MLAVVGYAVAPVVAERALQGVPTTVVTVSDAAPRDGGLRPRWSPLDRAAPGAGRPQRSERWSCSGCCAPPRRSCCSSGSIAEVGGPRATLVAYLNPVVAVLLGAAVLGEPLTASVALATVLILGGSALAACGERPRRSSPSRRLALRPRRPPG